jgi:PUA domain protein
MTIFDSREHLNVIAMNGELLFFNYFDGPYYPTLKLLHRCKCVPMSIVCRRITNNLSNKIDPDILPKVQVDRGAIKFVLQGANIMCPGLTSKGGRLDVDLPEGAVVCIMAEGKEHALGVGLLKMSTEQM